MHYLVICDRSYRIGMHPTMKNGKNTEVNLYRHKWRKQLAGDISYLYSRVIVSGDSALLYSHGCHRQSCQSLSRPTICCNQELLQSRVFVKHSSPAIAEQDFSISRGPFPEKLLLCVVNGNSGQITTATTHHELHVPRPLPPSRSVHWAVTDSWDQTFQVLPVPLLNQLLPQRLHLAL